jgi:hypothetical protein
MCVFDENPAKASPSESQNSRLKKSLRIEKYVVSCRTDGTMRIKRFPEPD